MKYFGNLSRNIGKGIGAAAITLMGFTAVACAETYVNPAQAPTATQSASTSMVPSATEFYERCDNTDRFLAMVNHRRQSYELNSLAINEKLQEAAQAQAEDMARLGYLSRVSPEGKGEYDFIEDVGLSIEGRILVYAESNNYQDPIGQAFFDLKNHPVYNGQMLYINLTETGIGLAYSENYGKCYLTQFTISPDNELIVPQVMPPVSASDSYDICGDPSVMIRLVNAHRKVNGRGPLEILDQLETSSQAKAEDMVTFQYFDHDSPFGKGFPYFLDEAGVSNALVGENLARNDYIHYNLGNPLEIAMRDLIASPGHNANMLSGYTFIGVGVSFYPPENMCYYVQHFAGG